MSTAATTPSTDAPLSEIERVVNTFVAPSKTFNDIRRSQSWWLPFVLLSLIGLGYGIVLGQKIGFDELTRSQIAQSSRAAQFEKLPAEQQERQIAIGAKFAQYFTYATPVLVLLGYVIVAAVLMATFNFGVGAEIPYSNSLAVIAYGQLPLLVFYALAIVSLLAGVKTEGFNPRNAVATNPAYFMDRVATNKFVYSLVSGLDVMAIWCAVLMGIGFAAQSKVKKGTAIGIVIAWYFVWKLLSGLFA